MDEDGEFESIHKFIKNKYKKNDLSVKAKTSSIRSTQLMYRFENFDDLSLCAKKLFEVYKGFRITSYNVCYTKLLREHRGFIYTQLFQNIVN